jgi:hypothetical protein
MGKNLHGLCSWFLRKTKGYDYLYVVVDGFNKMCVLMAYNKSIKGKRSLFFRVSMHFGILRRTIYDADTILLNVFWTSL